MGDNPAKPGVMTRPVFEFRFPDPRPEGPPKRNVSLARIGRTDAPNAGGNTNEKMFNMYFGCICKGIRDLVLHVLILKVPSSFIREL